MSGLWQDLEVEKEDEEGETWDKAQDDCEEWEEEDDLESLC